MCGHSSKAMIWSWVWWMVIEGVELRDIFVLLVGGPPRTQTLGSPPYNKLVTMPIFVRVWILKEHSRFAFQNERIENQIEGSGKE